MQSKSILRIQYGKIFQAVPRSSDALPTSRISQMNNVSKVEGNVWREPFANVAVHLALISVLTLPHFPMQKRPVISPLSLMQWWSRLFTMRPKGKRVLYKLFTPRIKAKLYIPQG